MKKTGRIYYQNQLNLLLMNPIAMKIFTMSKNLCHIIYTDTPNYRKRIINDANKSVISNYELYKHTHDTIFIFDDSIKGRGDMTITAADRMFNTIKDWDYKIIPFDNQLIIGDSPVLVTSESERQEISEIQIDSDVLNSNIVIEDPLTKRKKVYINNASENY